MRSPIDILIDKACGVPSDTAVRSSKLVMLRCPDCQKEKQVWREKTDDPQAQVIMLCCPECWNNTATTQPDSKSKTDCSQNASQTNDACGKKRMRGIKKGSKAASGE